MLECLTTFDDIAGLLKQQRIRAEKRISACHSGPAEPLMKGSEAMRCPVCTSPSSVKEHATLGDLYEVNCPTCGHFEISRSARKEFDASTVEFSERQMMLDRARSEAPSDLLARITMNLR
jgi:predicted RNA-binding Zn-ribbon protein involved in translation (DUF1610 family)